MGRASTATRPAARRRRLDILEATLAIIRRDGLRAVSHRSVATAAKVPLAATTYYFRDLEDLITESFLHWSRTPQQQVREFHAAALDVLQASGREGASPQLLAERLADVAAAYVVEQVTTNRTDRVLEFAFLHEAARMPRLRVVVRQRQAEDLQFLEQFHAELGSPRPAIDAQISYSLLLGLEKNALLTNAGPDGLASIRQVLVAYLRGAVVTRSRTG